MAGRIGVYVKEDEGCIVEITTITAQASRMPELKDFADRVARLAYGLPSPTWGRVASEYPQIENDRVRLCAVLQDRITVASMAHLA